MSLVDPKSFPVQLVNALIFSSTDSDDFHLQNITLTFVSKSYFIVFNQQWKNVLCHMFEFDFLRYLLSCPFLFFPFLLFFFIFVSLFSWVLSFFFFFFSFMSNKSSTTTRTELKFISTVLFGELLLKNISINTKKNFKWKFSCFELKRKTKWSKFAIESLE